MNSDEFLKAVKILEEEKHIDRETIFDAMELALTSAYKKHYGKPNCKVVINKETGEIKVYSYKTVVEDIYAEDDEEEELDENGEVIVKNKPKYNVAPEEIKISLEDARKIDKRYELGDTVDTEVTPHDFGRVAASTAKQVVIQKIREAERESLISEFKDKEGELVQGVAELEDEGNYYINLGRTNGILSKKELIGDEKIEMGSSVKAYVSKVDSNNKGTIILLTRRHPNFVKRLFELEIPELADGSVVIYGVARDPGVRSKVSVFSEYANIDPIGCCIGEKGSRISNIIKELNGEKLDIIKYDEDKETYIKNSLSPAKNVRVFILDPKKQEALAIADGEDFSLALGKKGSNVRLASRLTKYKIDVKTSEQVQEMGITIK
ncbi:MAG: transcription termination factor NusA [bacterium]|nr:transcription termination factor NusA [bacterium]